MSTKATKCPECGKPYIHFDVHRQICEKNPNKDNVSEPTMSSNIDTTEGLDQILSNYLGRLRTYEQVHKGLKENQTHDREHATYVTKQAILDWVNEVVIGEDQQGFKERSSSKMSYFYEWRTLVFKHLAGPLVEPCAHSFPFHQPIDGYDIRVCEYCDGLYLGYKAKED